MWRPHHKRTGLLSIGRRTDAQGRYSYGRRLRI
jgi:hypothetical protein